MFLLEASFREWRRYDPSKTRMKFSSWLYDKAYNRVTDWFRHEKGRSEGKRQLTRVASEEERYEDPSQQRSWTDEVLANVALDF